MSPRYDDRGLRRPPPPWRRICHYDYAAVPKRWWSTARVDQVLREVFGSAVVDRCGGNHVAIWRVQTPLGDIRVTTDDLHRRVRWLRLIHLTLEFPDPLLLSGDALSMLNWLNKIAPACERVYVDDQSTSAPVLTVTRTVYLRGTSRRAVIAELRSLPDSWAGELSMITTACDAAIQ